MKLLTDHRVAITVFVLVVLGLEYYVYQGLNDAFGTSVGWPFVFGIDIFTILVFFTTFISLGVFYKGGISKTIWWINILLGLTIAFSFTKLCYFVFSIISSFLQYVIDGEAVYFIYIPFILSAIPLLTFLLGVFRGRYNFKVFKETLAFNDLPNAFDGFKIIQISDVHSGSFDSKKAMQKGLDLIMAQKPDLILFTGDLVNNLAMEFEPYIDQFKKLEAPHGKFSILGNHDYGLYMPFKSKEAHVKNNQEIIEHHPAMGFDLLLNENRLIEKDGESIRLIGVENWGRPPFPPHGDLDKAIEGTHADEFSILMSHDPHHWEDKVLPHNKHFNITLSGHTHGMQLGFDYKWFKWSPIKVRYKNWAGLYKKNNQYLYVNRGFGHLGFPGRVGIKPEITVLELKCI